MGEDERGVSVCMCVRVCVADACVAEEKGSCLSVYKELYCI